MKWPTIVQRPNKKSDTACNFRYSQCRRLEKRTTSNNNIIHSQPQEKRNLYKEILKYFFGFFSFAGFCCGFLFVRTESNSRRNTTTTAKIAQPILTLSYCLLWWLRFVELVYYIFVTFNTQQHNEFAQKKNDRMARRLNWQLCATHIMETLYELKLVGTFFQRSKSLI